MPEPYPYVRPESPPTSYAIASLLEGEEGSIVRVVSGAATRGLFLMPGLYMGLRLVGIKPKLGQIAGAALIGSASISFILVGYYALRRAGKLPALPSR